MTLNIENHGGVAVVHLHGELTVRDHEELVEAVTDLLTGPGARIVIDLREVPFLDSTGLGGLVRIVAQANVQEGRVVLAGPSPFVEGVLQTTQLDRFFELHPTVPAALAAL